MQSTIPGGCQCMTNALRDQYALLCSLIIIIFVSPLTVCVIRYLLCLIRFLLPSGMNKILDITQIDEYARSGNLT